MIIYQDPHLADKELWQNFKSLWAAGDYESALEILQNTQLTNKVVNATVFNDITDAIIEREETQDVSFKQDIIKVATTPPADIQSGEVYFQLT